MPLYEYQCQQCHRRVEKIQKFSDAPLTTCPHCGGTLERTLTAPAIQFKGSGWYKDLYSSAKPSTGGNSEGSGAAASSGDAGSSSKEGGGDSKPAGAPAATAAPSAPAASTTSGTKD